MADTNIIRTRSLGVPSEGIRDQYADGIAAKVWEFCIGDHASRAENYKTFLIDLLRRKGCERILDASCGTGFDSIMMIEEGFDVVSIDGSDQMLKYALKKRWNRRKEHGFDKWVIEEANWLTLYDDIEQYVGDGFDAVICLGNSFALLTDQQEHKQAMRNFEKCVRPGGFLLMDHRNYDNIVDSGHVATKSIYYNSKYLDDIKSYVVFSQGKPCLVIADYSVDTSELYKRGNSSNENYISKFRNCYYPHTVTAFGDLLRGTFGENAHYKIFGDFKYLNEIETPNYYIHLVEKAES